MTRTLRICKRLIGVSLLGGLFPVHAATCSAQFSVMESSLDPTLGAEIKVIDSPGSHVRPRIPAKQTDVKGIARFEGLSPQKTPHLVFAVSAGGRSTTVLVDLSRECHGIYRVVLPDKVRPER